MPREGAMKTKRAKKATFQKRQDFSKGTLPASQLLYLAREAALEDTQGRLSEADRGKIWRPVGMKRLKTQGEKEGSFMARDAPVTEKGTE